VCVLIEPLEVQQCIADGIDGTDEFIQLDLDCFRIALLSVLGQEHHADVTNVVPELMASCQESLNPDRRPLTSHANRQRELERMPGEPGSHLGSSVEGCFEHSPLPHAYGPVGPTATRTDTCKS
jgi:hypothetical protein